MRYRKLSPLGDYSFGNGQLDFYRDVPEAVGQAVKTRLMLWLGEWYLNTNSGTPYIQGVLGKKTEAQANAVIQDRVIRTQGASRIKNYESSLNADTRHFSVQFDLDTIYGPTEVEVLNYGNF